MVNYKRRLGASSLKIVVNVPNMNCMIGSPGGKRKGLHHRTNRTQPYKFSRYDESVIGSDQANLNEASVRLAGKEPEEKLAGD